MPNVNENHVSPSALNRIEPGPGQESVWDYPKPPSYEPVAKRIRVEFGGEVIAETRCAIRVLQTGIPPVYYVPRDDVRMEFLTPTDHHSHCPFKGDADYWSVRVGDRQVSNAAWSYPSPLPEASVIEDHVAFYAHLMDGCYVDEERAGPPDWKWIGGWVTPEIVGPFVRRDDIPRVEELQSARRSAL